VYYPSSTTAEAPSTPDDRDVRYKLVEVFEAGGLWDNRALSSLFAGFGSFAGDNGDGCGSGAIGCTSNSANAPCGWDDSNDRPARGALAVDPASLVSNYFHIPETVSQTYTFNPYQ
jgi:hypothetical protein